MTTEARRRKPLGVLVAAVVIVATLWVIYWYAANRMAFLAIDRALAAVSSGGQVAECSPRALGGFPFVINVSCGGIKLTDRNSGLSLSASRVAATAPLYWPLHVEAVAVAPVLVKIPGDPTDIKADWKAASLKFDAGILGLSRAEGRLESLAVDGPLELPHLALAGLTADKATLELAPNESRPGDYGLAFSVDRIGTKSSDSRTLPEISARANFTAFGLGRSLGLDPKKTLAGWAGSGGKAQLDDLHLAVGPITVSASGPLTVSPEGLLSGKITVRFVNLEQLPAILEAVQPGSRNAEAFAKLLMAVTKKVETEIGPARETILNLNNGNLFFGIVPIGAIPPLM